MTGSTVGTPSAMLTFLLIIIIFFLRLLFLLLAFACTNTGGGGGGGGEVCAWQESRSSRRDHVEAPSSGMEAGGGVQSSC